jgi:hypothetical protein
LLRLEWKRFRIPPLQDDAEKSGAPNEEALLGGLFGALQGAGLINQKTRRIIAARRDMLADVDEADREAMLAAFESSFEQVIP